MATISEGFISLHRISHSFDDETWILKDVQLQIQKGDFLYVVGGSGAGKSSLLRLLALRDEPKQGVLSVGSVALGGSQTARFLQQKRQISYIPQHLDLIQGLSLEDNVWMGYTGARFMSPSHNLQTRLIRLLETLKLLPLRHRLVETLSGGEAQRVMVARALMSESPCLIADEPTGAQDREMTWIIMDLLVKAHQAQKTVIVATHDREIVRRVRRRCALIQNGHVSLEDPACFY